LGRAYPQLAEQLLRHTDLSEPCHVLIAGTPRSGRAQFIEDLEILLETKVEVTRLAVLPRARDLGGGLIALVGGDVDEWLVACLSRGLDESLLGSLADGGVVLASQAACAVFGSWVILDGLSAVSPALGWLPRALIAPDAAGEPVADQILRLLREQDHAYAIGLLPEAILALGPRGEVEAWGDVPPRVTLGKGWK
jgi:hypothetical protein